MGRDRGQETDVKLLETELSFGIEAIGGFFRRLYTYTEGEPSCLIIYGGVPYWIEFNLPGCITDDALISKVVRGAGGIWLVISDIDGVANFLNKIQETVLEWDYDEEEIS